MVDRDADHRRTLWWADDGACPASIPPDPDRRLDVAVIGGGFTGLTAALHLARRGARVAVFEAGEVGQGASGRNAGFVVPNFAKADPAAVRARLGTERGERLLRAVGGGAERVFATARAHDIACDAEPVGWMHLAHAPRMLDVLAARAEAWAALGRPVRMLSEAEARALSGARHCLGALFDPSGGTIHPLAYLRGLARAAVAAGAGLHERAGIAAVERQGTGWALRVGGYRVVADRVVLATNAGTAGAARRLGRTVVPLRVYQIATEPLAPAVAARVAPGRNPVADTRGNLFTYRLDRDDRLVTGGMAIVPLGAHRRMARALAARLVAELDLPAPPAVARVWRGTAAMTPDFLPRIVPFGPGFVGGIGCNGRGIAVTAVLGLALAEVAAGGRLDEQPIPVAEPRPIPFHPLAGWLPSLAVAGARWQDRRDGL